MCDRIRNLFEEATLDEILASRDESAPRELITVNQDSSMHACLQAMISHHVSSVPVLDAHGHVIRVVDMPDVCRTLVEGLSEAEGWKSWPDYKFAELLDEIAVADAVDFSKGDPLLVANSSTSVESVMKFFAAGVNHRCVVRFDGLHEYGIISQVDLVSWIASKIEENTDIQKKFLDIPLFDELKNRSLQAHKVVSALWSSSVFDVLKLLLEEKVHAIALVDENGKLQANFSATDLMHIDAGSVHDIQLSGRNYLKKYSRCSLTPISFLDNETGNLAETVMMFSGIGIHRIWLVDSPMYSTFQPTGVFTVTDVLQVTHKHFFS